MSEKTIKLLYINAQIRALININQAPAGETGSAAVTQPIAAGSSFFVSMLPLENAPGLVYLPYTRRISLAKADTSASGSDLITLCTWPDNIVELDLEPLYVYRSEESALRPEVLSPFEFYISGDKHTAFIYNEAVSSFAIEQSSSSRLRFISPLPFTVAHADISFTKFGDFPVIYAAGKTNSNEQFLYAATILPEFCTAVCTVCDRYNIADDSISIITAGDYLQERVRYTREGDRLAPTAFDVGWFTQSAKKPSNARELCTGLLQAVRADAQQAAIDCLTDSLAAGLSFADLKEFFGDFTHITDAISPVCSANSIALKYATEDGRYAARVFCAETKETRTGLKIDNLKEP